jgi:lipoyl(octanoyl) transferase
MTVLVARNLGRRPLRAVWEQMQQFTDSRDSETPDEVWFVEHDPVFTLGLNADRAHVLRAAEIDVVQIDRGGQVTYHGPGQIVAYVMLDLRRLGIAIRALVEMLERAVIDTVAEYGIAAQSRRDAPGVYVDGAKLAAIGLRVRKGCSYHGLALNVDMDLAPFEQINPCGMQDLPVTQLADLGVDKGIDAVRRDLLCALEHEVQTLAS